jgi:dTDP-4-dehydrorhamnose reductase
MQMRVAITGANGLLGGEAVAQLQLDARHEVLALGRGPCRLPPGRYGWADVDLGDGRSTGEALRAFGAQAVLHSGALTDVDACEREPLRAWRVNVDGTAEVAVACAALSARLVAVSTDYVFDGTAGPYGEDDLPNARGVYARTKRCGEEAALLLAAGCAVARVAVVYGGNPRARTTFATTSVERLSRGEQVRAFSDQYVSTTLASAGAERCLELLLASDHRGVLHLSDADVVDRVAFTRRLARRFGLREDLVVPVKLAELELLAPRPLRGGLKVDRATSLLASKPLSLDQALERFHAEWMRRGPA